jgi:L-lactate utilization protein LutC
MTTLRDSILALKQEQDSLETAILNFHEYHDEQHTEREKMEQRRLTELMEAMERHTTEVQKATVQQLLDALVEERQHDQVVVSCSTELVHAIFERLQEVPVKMSMYSLENMIRDIRLVLYYVNLRLIDVGGLMWWTRQLAIRLPLLLEQKRLHT